MSAAPLRYAPSPSTATRTAPRPVPERRAPGREGTSAHLRAVAAPQQGRSLGVFAGLCIAVVLAALATVLLVNTVMARGAYDSVQLRREIAELHQDRAALLTQLEAASAPEGLAATAQALGMQPAPQLGFVFLEGGSVLEPGGY